MQQENSIKLDLLVYLLDSWVPANLSAEIAGFLTKSQKEQCMNTNQYSLFPSHYFISRTNVNFSSADNAGYVERENTSLVI